jgi:response regulator RpfG family c-di-GMP phosphodiesterase
MSKIMSQVLVSHPMHITRVFLVEDDSLARQKLSRALRDDGYAVIEADRAALLDRARAVAAGSELSEIDIIVSDARGLDDRGYAALRELRHFDWVLPIVLLAPAINPTFAEHARQLNADTLVTEPLDAEQVRTTVEHIVAPS